MAGKLEGRRIAITGAGSGIGQAIAELFAAEGASLALLGRTPDKLDAVASPIGARAYQCDVASLEAVEAALLPAIDALGGLDGVVNAAGLLVIKPFAQLDLADWNSLLATNMSGPFYVVRTALPALMAEPKATILNISSASGYLPMAGTAAYSASKAGLIMFTKGLAFDLGPKIRANTICPGVVETEMTRYLWENKEHLDRAAERTALKKIGHARDIATAALYLTSDDSSFVTGTEILIDGGFTWR